MSMRAQCTYPGCTYVAPDSAHEEYTDLSLAVHEAGHGSRVLKFSRKSDFLTYGTTPDASTCDAEECNCDGSLAITDRQEDSSASCREAELSITDE